ncbi:MAG: hypothetical protein ACYDAK_11865 [Candidatus Limnocylindrales bacterium]
MIDESAKKPLQIQTLPPQARSVARSVRSGAAGALLKSRTKRGKIAPMSAAFTTADTATRAVGPTCVSRSTHPSTTAQGENSADGALDASNGFPGLKGSAARALMLAACSQKSSPNELFTARATAKAAREIHTAT